MAATIDVAIESTELRKKKAQSLLTDILEQRKAYEKQLRAKKSVPEGKCVYCEREIGPGRKEETCIECARKLPDINPSLYATRNVRVF